MHILGSVAFHSQHRKILGYYSRSLLRTENDKGYISEKTNGAFFTDWKRNEHQDVLGLRA